MWGFLVLSYVHQCLQCCWCISMNLIQLSAWLQLPPVVAMPRFPGANEPCLVVPVLGYPRAVLGQNEPPRHDRGSCQGYDARPPEGFEARLNQTLPHVARPLRLATGAGCALVMRLFSSRSFVIPLVKAHMTITGTPNWALTVKTTVPTPCTPPFPEILSNRVPGVSRPAARELIRFPRECLSGG